MRRMIIGHRGASCHAPENTIAAFLAAAQAGSDAVEFDVSLTGDGVPVVHHDRLLGRCVEGYEALSQIAWKTLQKRDAGSWFASCYADERVPNLAQAIRTVFAQGMDVVAELKIHEDETTMLGKAVLPVLEAFDPARILVTSFNREVLHYLRAHKPEMRLGLVATELPDDWLDLTRSLPLSTIHLDHTKLDLADVARLCQQLTVGVYTLNDAKRAKTLAAAGVRQIITDDPGRMRSMINQP
ncbi:MAG: glycerophosphodiester phosphodiesterase family protein [Pseudomonadota bacterium]